MILLQPMFNVTFLLHLCEKVVGVSWNCIQPIKGFILLPCNGFLCFAGIVSDARGTAYSRPSVYHQVLAVGDDVCQQFNLLFKHLWNVHILIGFVAIVTRPGKLI